MLLKHYYHSLLTEYTLLTSTKGNETVSKSDYYKICIKGLLLQCLRISSAFDQESLVELLSEYTRHFSKTLTYAAELKDYWQTLIQHAVLCPEPVQDDNSLIIHINYTKISLSVSTTSFSGQNILEVVDKLTEAYR